MKKVSLSIIAIALISLQSIVNAQSLLPKASLIVKNTNERDDGKFLTQTTTLELIDKRGKKKIQVSKSFRKYYGNDKVQVFFYQSPTNIRGTAFLTFDYIDKEDDRWLYLPALRKTRRISGSEKGDYFLGTDLTYEDINLGSKISETDYYHKVVGTEIIDGHNCYVLENIPKTLKLKKELKYSKTKSWIDVEIWMVRKAEFWDVQGNALKTLYLMNIKKIDGIWTASTLHVKNHKTNHQTYLRFTNIDYKTPFDDDLFTEESLVNGL